VAVRARIETFVSSVRVSASGQENPTNRALPTSTGPDCNRVPNAAGVAGVAVAAGVAGVPLTDPGLGRAALPTAPVVGAGAGVRVMLTFLRVPG